MRKTIKQLCNIFNIVLCSILFIVFIILFIYISYSLINPIRLPSVLQHSLFTVVSGSMEPEIKVNDIVLVKKTHYSELQEGDVIVYFSEDKDILIIHRLISMENGMAITKGDANFLADTPFSVTQIYGKKICTIPHIGQMLFWFRERPIIRYLFCFGILFYLILSSYLYHRAKNKGNPKAP